MYVIVPILCVILPTGLVITIIGLAALAKNRRKSRGVKRLTKRYNLRNSRGPIAALYRLIHKDWYMH